MRGGQPGGVPGRGGMADAGWRRHLTGQTSSDAALAIASSLVAPTERNRHGMRQAAADKQTGGQGPTRTVDGMRLHLSSHHDDGTPGTAVLVVVRNVEALHAEL